MMLSIQRTIQIGLVKKMDGSPFDKANERKKFGSAMEPKIAPSKNAAVE